MSDDEVAVLREALTSHQAMVTGALAGNDQVDIRRAFAIHADMARILAQWDTYSAHEQREIVKTVQYIIDTEDDDNDLTSPDGFLDDMARVDRLQQLLGFV
ncbi:hypothetical protein FHX74_003400 [Friedmanniella endophytica]|uniref:Uncharacterized protein n=1 Tax=Microlunatus kandeliicorticis TaxID=1759536 RepID=A0A7W3IV38_9ACTN|nr:hypothetical protein [Microlunatus kandeliicorticis]MBA8795759.1 hypothetical protein [Microlunatus kandeliicorticis]